MRVAFSAGPPCFNSSVCDVPAGEINFRILEIHVAHWLILKIHSFCYEPGIPALTILAYLKIVVLEHFANINVNVKKYYAQKGLFKRSWGLFVEILAFYHSLIRPKVIKLIVVLSFYKLFL